jgi:hypothetical protein
MRETKIIGSFGNSENKLNDLRNFCYLVDRNYRGPYNRLVNLLSKYKQFGGELKTITINKKGYKINVQELEDDNNNLDISLITIDGAVHCGTILINKSKPKEAILEDMHAFDNCYETTIEDKKSGKIVMKILIELCKEKGVEVIKLADISHIPCGSSNSLDLKMVYTMTHGVPWYHQFGFIPKKSIDKEIMKHNYLIMKDKKVKDVKKEVFISEEYMKLYDKYKEELLISFIERLGKRDCKTFLIYYKTIYKNLGLLELIGKKMILKLK